MSFFVFQIYRWILVPIAGVIFQLGRWIGDEKWKKLVELKNAGRIQFRTEAGFDLMKQKPFWIHAASGEIEYARPVIRALKKAYPETPVVVTYSSPSALRMIEAESAIDAYLPVPWESAGAFDRFFAQVNPRALLIARTDAWPVMVTETYRRGIPALLFAATFAEKSSRLGFGTRAITAWSLARLHEIQVVSDEDRELIQPLVPNAKIKVSGDTRFDQVFHRLEHPRFDASDIDSSSPILVAGSTWPEDEAVLLPAFAKSPAWRYILAPHETQAPRLAALEKQMDELGLTHQRLSADGDWTAKVLLIDRVGLLAELYTRGDLAFVGGSFRKNVHSVMEPMAAGLRVLVGPHHRNNREALHFQIQSVEGEPIVQTVNSTAELEQKLASHGASSVKTQIQAALRRHTGATEAVLDFVRRH